MYIMNNKYIIFKSQYGGNKKDPDENVEDIDDIDDITNEPYDVKPVDLNLIFDLLQMSQDILLMTEKDDIIIMVGDTPSYLKPFLEPFRKVHNLPLSNKVYGCFDPPYGLPEDDELFTPKFNLQEKYFNYLNTKTELTKKYVKENWHKLILIDSSSGQSIHGVSIFLNRYIGNIKPDVKCVDINGANPIFFINLQGNKSKMLNVDGNILKKYNYGFSIRNFNPRLIILIGEIDFLHEYFVKINEDYPRYVPFLDIRYRFKYEDPVYKKEGLDVIKIFKSFVKLFYKYQKSNNNDLVKLLKLIKQYPADEKYEHMIRSLTDKNVTVKKLEQLFNTIDIHILTQKNIPVTNFIKYKIE